MYHKITQYCDLIGEIMSEKINNIKFDKFHEDKIHGTSLRPFAKYRNVIGDNLPTFPAHWHDEFEIIKVQSGGGTFIIDSRQIQAHEGDIIFVNPRSIHEIVRHKDCEMIIDSILFDLHILESTVADACTIKYLAPMINGIHFAPDIVRTKFSDYHVFDENMTTIFQAYNDSIPGWEMAVKANLFWVIYHLYRCNLMTKLKRFSEEAESESVKPALDVIKNAYAEELQIPQLAEKCGFSETYFMKLFKKATGMTCVDYINRVRLAQAAGHLLSSSSSIIDIALGVGYNNVSYFNRQFKAVYGVTPKEYRHTAREQNNSQISGDSTVIEL